MNHSPPDSPKEGSSQRHGPRSRRPGRQPERSVEDLLAERTAVLSQVSDGVVLTDAQAVITFVNPSARRLFGDIQVGNSLARRSRRLQWLNPVGHPLPPRAFPVARAALHGESALDGRWRVQRSDGSIVDLQGSAIPLFGPDGSRIGAALVCRDVSVQREIERQRDLALAEAEAERDTLDQILEVLPEGLAIADATGRVVRRNRASLELSTRAGYSPVPGSIRPVWQPDGTLCEVDEFPLQRSVAVGDTIRGKELLVGGPDPSHAVPVLINSAPLRDYMGKITGGVVVYQDISRLKRVETKLRQANEAKDAFLALLAHELRNPLAPMLSAIHLLGAAEAHTPRWDRAYEIVLRQVQHMARLLDDLLDVSRIRRGRIQLQWQSVDLNATVDHALESCRTLIDSVGHQVTVELPEERLFIRGDAVRIEQVFCNLLNNAAKYTDPGGHIQVELKKDLDHAVIVVRDTGVGVAPALLARIFDLFMQADRSLDRSRGGLGIGLALAQSIIGLHGGTIAAESEGPGRGTQFTIRLPMEAGGAAASQTPAALGGEPTAEKSAVFPLNEICADAVFKVLLIEDNPDGREALRDLLSLWGHSVEVAEDGPAGVRIAAEVQPDVIVIDIGLPGMDGYSVARSIRKTLAGRPCYLIAATGYGQPSDRKKALDAGFDRHLVKPVNPEELHKIIVERRHVR